MNYLRLNCRGFGNPRTIRVSNNLVRNRKPEVMFFIETISVASKIDELRIKFNFTNCFSVDHIGRCGGLAVLWKHHIDCNITGYSQNYIDIVFKEKTWIIGG